MHTCLQETQKKKTSQQASLWTVLNNVGVIS